MKNPKQLAKRLYQTIFELLSLQKNLEEIKINENLYNRLLFLITVLYNIENKEKNMDMFQNIIDVYYHVFKKDLDILEIKKDEMTDEFIDENINWVRICLLNRVKYEMGDTKFIVNNNSDIEKLSKNILSNPNLTLVKASSSDNLNNQQNTNQSFTNNANANNPNASANFGQFQVLTPEQQKILQSKLQFFNPFDSKPILIPFIKKAIGILSVIMILMSILYPTALLLDTKFLNWLAIQAGGQHPVIIHAVDWIKQFAMQLPYVLIYGALSYFMLRRYRSVQEKYMINSIIFWVLILFTFFDLITFILKLRTFVWYLSTSDLISNHIFLFIVYIFMIPVIISFIVTLFVAIFKRPKINQEKLANFIQQQINEIVKK